MGPPRSYVAACHTGGAVYGVPSGASRVTTRTPQEGGEGLRLEPVQRERQRRCDVLQRWLGVAGLDEGVHLRARAITHMCTCTIERLTCKSMPSDRVLILQNWCSQAVWRQSRRSPLRGFEPMFDSTTAPTGAPVLAQMSLLPRKQARRKAGHLPRPPPLRRYAAHCQCMCPQHPPQHRCPRYPPRSTVPPHRGSRRRCCRSARPAIHCPRQHRGQ